MTQHNKKPLHRCWAVIVTDTVPKVITLRMFTTYDPVDRPGRYLVAVIVGLGQSILATLNTDREKHRQGDEVTFYDQEGSRTSNL